MKWNGYKTRICCGTTYDCHHRNDCTVRSDEARAAMPCEITADGWCRSHSTGAGPAYCATTPTTPDEGTDPMTSHEEGNCVELYDPVTGETEGGWGPVGCPCQDETGAGDE